MVLLPANQNTQLQGISSGPKKSIYVDFKPAMNHELAVFMEERELWN